MDISSTQLSHLGHYTKALVNDGIYYLYKSKDRGTVGVKYYLKTNTGDILSLSSEGRILERRKNVLPQLMGEHVYFNDIETSQTNSSLIASV